MRPLTLRLVSLGLALGMMLSSNVALAAPPAPSAEALKEAKVHYERGTALYNDLDFKLALIEFKRAYELAPNYKILYNIGQVNLQLNNYADALQALESYLTQGGNNVPAKRQKDVQKDVVALKARTAHITVNVNVTGAEVSLDDNVIGASQSTLVDAGQHRVSARAEGHVTASKTITLAGGDDSKVDLELAEIPPPVATNPGPGPTFNIDEDFFKKHMGGGQPGQAPPPPPSYTWIGWGATGVLAVGAIATGVVALKSSSDLKNDKTGPTTSAALTSDANRARSFGIITDALVGAAIVTAGVTLYFTLKKPHHAEPVKVGVGPGALHVVGSF